MSGRHNVVTNPYAKKKRTSDDVGDDNNHGGALLLSKHSRPRHFSATNSSVRRPANSDNKDGGATASSAFSELTAGGRSFSFSQAFSSVEDSPYFQSAVQEAKKNNNNLSTLTMSEKELQERAAQRAMDTATASKGDNSSGTNQGDTKRATATSASTSTADPTLLLSDRDMQVMGASAHPHVLYVSPKQRGNIVLQYVRNVPTQFLRMVPDYLFSTTQCALFLSLKYHSLYPRYIRGRMDELQSDFVLRILLVLVDVQDNAALLRQLNELAVTNRMTLLLAWTAEEAGRYLETFKSFQGKDASLIQKRTSTSHVDQVTDFLTACPGINKTDAANLLGQFGTMRALATKGTTEELTLVPGLGQVKVTRLYEAFCKPFSKKAARARRLQKSKQQEQRQEAEKEEEMDGEHESIPDTENEQGEYYEASEHNKTATKDEKDSKDSTVTNDKKP
ncbi:hypothetical protein ACA910_000594 [Epithemia clementina (nom. ined.)]